MSWRDHLTGFDTETDGPNPEDARIITACLGIASVDGWTARNWMLQPERDIPEEATAVHGITTEMARIDGIGRPEGIGQIADVIRGAWQAGSVLVGHNVVYDLTVLDREMRRTGHGPLEVAGAVVDTLVLDKAIDRYRRGKRTLITTAAHYGFNLSESEAHGAEADALASCRIAWRIATGHPEVGRLDPSELSDWHRDHYREQRLSFAEYRRKKGEPLEDENTDWPVRRFNAGRAAA